MVLNPGSKPLTQGPIIHCIPDEETEAHGGHPQLTRGGSGNQNPESARLE